MKCSVELYFSSEEVDRLVDKDDRCYHRYFKFDFIIEPQLGDFVCFDDHVAIGDEKFLITLEALAYPYFKVRRRWLHYKGGELNLELELIEHNPN